MFRVAALVVSATLLVSCSSSTDGRSEPEERDKPEQIEVEWSKYAPAVQGRIDDLADDGDCRGLQQEFDTADKNDERVRQQSGTGTADLLDYIDAKMAAADCY